VQYLTSITREVDLGRRLGPMGSGLDHNKLDRPISVAHENGRLYVVDRAYQKIIIADLKEKSLEGFPGDRREGAMIDPTSIVIVDGRKYVADRGRGQVLVYDENNDYVRPYGRRDQFKGLSAVAVHGNKVYVCESTENRIVVLDRESGEEIARLGAGLHEESGKDYWGDGAGEFNTPTHLAVTAKGELLVVDSLNMRMQFFDAEGNFIQQIGGPYAGPGGVVRPRGIAISQDGLAYLADAALEFVQIFDVGKGVGGLGQALLHFGKAGTGPGATILTSSVHIDHDNVEAFAKYADPDFKLEYLIYVGSQRATDALNVYGFGHWIGRPLD
jgi:DNA-binding beta-propeller fold protein YncE